MLEGGFLRRRLAILAALGIVISSVAAIGCVSIVSDDWQITSPWAYSSLGDFSNDGETSLGGGASADKNIAACSLLYFSLSVIFVIIVTCFHYRRSFLVSRGGTAFMSPGFVLICLFAMISLIASWALNACFVLGVLDHGVYRYDITICVPIAVILIVWTVLRFGFWLSLIYIPDTTKLLLNLYARRSQLFLWSDGINIVIGLHGASATVGMSGDIKCIWDVDMISSRWAIVRYVTGIVCQERR